MSEIKYDMDTITALASGVKEQIEFCIQTLSDPSKLDSKQDFIILLNKIANDFIMDESTQDAIIQIALLIETSETMQLEHLKQYTRQWNFIKRQMMAQMPYIMSERVGLKVALLPYMKGQRHSSRPVDLKKFEGVK